MGYALSTDLRVRVLAAVTEGATHRQAAARFGVSAASVSRWRTLAREQGDVRPGALGGDRRSGHPVEHRPALAPVFAIGTLRRFFKRHRITRKKRQLTPPSRTAPTS